MSYQLGIDLGTTYTAAAVLRAGSTAAEPVNLGTGAATVSSVLYVGADGSILVGEAAERRAITEPDRVAREFKRRIGDETPFILGGREYRAHELAALLVRWVTDRVAERSGGPATGITVTHPASWREHRKELLAQALERIGRRVSFLAEPQAAAVSYASAERVAPGSTIAVYDLGGGTFDAAVVRKNGTFTLLGEPEGIGRLGGLDFDELIFEQIRRKVGDSRWEALDPTDPDVISAVGQLRRECVEAKIALSTDTQATIPVLLPGMQGQLKLSRDAFESMIRGSLEATVASLRQTITSAGLEPADLSAVLLVGGSSRIPAVAETVARELGRPVALDADPQLAIALGAAISAAAINGARADADGGAAAAAAALGAVALAGAAPGAAPSATPYPPGPPSGPIQVGPPSLPPTGAAPAGYAGPSSGSIPMPAGPSSGPIPMPAGPPSGPFPVPAGPPSGPIPMPAGPPSGPISAGPPTGGWQQQPPGPPPRPDPAPKPPPAGKPAGGRRTALIAGALVLVLLAAAAVAVILFRERAVPGSGAGVQVVAATISVPGRPDGLAVSPDGSRLYVTDLSASKVTVIDTAGNSVLTSFALPEPVGIVISPDGKRAYVANLAPSTVSIIDTANNAVVKTVPVGDQPVRMAITDDGSRVYVANQGSGSVSVIDTATEAVIATPRVAPGPIHVKITPDQAKLYVMSPGANTVTILDVATNRRVGSFRSPDGPFTVSFSPDGARAYLTDHEADTLRVLDAATNNVLATVKVGEKPVRTVTTPDGKRVYVTALVTNTVAVIDTASNAIISTIPVAESPSDALVSPDGSRIYLTSFGTGTVTVINTAA